MATDLGPILLDLIAEQHKTILELREGNRILSQHLTPEGAAALGLPVPEQPERPPQRIEPATDEEAREWYLERLPGGMPRDWLNDYPGDPKAALAAFLTLADRFYGKPLRVSDIED